MTTDEPAHGRLEGRVHLLAVRVYYEDTDFSGRVYHARYLQFMERGRSELLRALGVVHAELLARPEPLMFAVTRMDITFKAAARIDDALLVRTSVRAARGARLVLEQEIRRGVETLVAASVEAACLTADGRPRRAPPEVAAALKRLAAPG